MKKYFVPLVLSTALLSAPAALAHVSQLSKTWSATGSVTSKQPTKAPSGAKLDPANAVVKAKDVDASIEKALDLVEERLRYQNASVSRALEAQSKNASINARSQAESVRSYIQNSMAQVDKKIAESAKETKATVEQLKGNFRKFEDVATSLEKQTSGQIAMSLAAASLSFDTLPKSISVAGSVAYFDGSSAIAGGVGYSDPTGYRVSGRVTTDLKTFGISIGVGYSF